jgi:hypothetical protein
MIERVFVDFNTMNQDLWSDVRRVIIHWSEVKPHFQAGMEVILTDKTLEVKAVLEFDDEFNHWLARPDWSTAVDLPCP